MLLVRLDILVARSIRFMPATHQMVKIAIGKGADLSRKDVAHANADIGPFNIRSRVSTFKVPLRDSWRERWACSPQTERCRQANRTAYPRDLWRKSSPNCPAARSARSTTPGVPAPTSGRVLLAPPTRKITGRGTEPGL